MTRIARICVAIITSFRAKHPQFEIITYETVPTSSDPASRWTSILIDLIAVITGLKIIRSFRLVDSQDSITAKSKATIIGTSILIDIVTVIARLAFFPLGEIQATNPITTAGQRAVVETSIGIA
jgi:hypothetical protein